MKKKEKGMCKAFYMMVCQTLHHLHAVAGGVLLLLVPAACITLCNVVYQRQQKNKKQGLKQHHESESTSALDVAVHYSL